MITPNDIPRLVKEISIIGRHYNLNITPIFVAEAGIGKSQSITNLAKTLDASTLAMINCGNANEGEVGGLPHDDGDKIRFVLHDVFNKLKKVQERYFQKGITEGFLNGKLKIVDNGMEYENEEGEKIFYPEPYIDREDNNLYCFGEGLPVELKEKLIESGEIKPAVLFFEELNRCDKRTMQEMMAPILDRNVNGYKIPWFTISVAAANPPLNDDYAVTEFDVAQGDRFLEILIDRDNEEWAEYMIEKKYELPTVSAALESITATKKGRTDYAQYSIIPNGLPSCRSMETACAIFDSIELLENSSLLTTQEKKEMTEKNDIRTLISGKLRPDFARVFIENAKKTNSVKPSEILTGSQKVVDKKIVEKWNTHEQSRKALFVSSFLSYLKEELKKIQKKAEADPIYAKNVEEQFTFFIKDMLDDALRQKLIAELVADADSLIIASTLFGDTIKYMLKYSIDFNTNVKNILGAK